MIQITLNVRVPEGTRLCHALGALDAAKAHLASGHERGRVTGVAGTVDFEIKPYEGETSLPGDSRQSSTPMVFTEQEDN